MLYKSLLKIYLSHSIETLFSHVFRSFLVQSVNHGMDNSFSTYVKFCVRTK